jgi:L-iditol 2-dehydrogenase
VTHRLARYFGQGQVEIRSEPLPELPEGGILIRSLASGLCSGELMGWYMDQKVPHVLGHEVCGIVEASNDLQGRFPVGSLVAPHHHAPDPTSRLTRRGASVHDPQWRATRLNPGGLAETVAVPALNLSDTHRVDDLRPRDAALMEPLGCVCKAIRRLSLREDDRIAVVGLGVMGLMFMLALPGAVGCDINPSRVAWARSLGLDGRTPDQMETSDVVVICPGTQGALETGLSMAGPDPRVCLFAPMPPGEVTPLDLHRLYFSDLTLTCSYSAGPEDCLAALTLLREGKVKAEQVVSHFIGLDDLPSAYLAMRNGDILKAMVLFDSCS